MTDIENFEKLKVKLVTSEKDVLDFLKVPFFVYGTEDARAPPLLFERKLALQPSQPIFQHLEWQGFTVYKADQPVGRISAQIDKFYSEKHGGKTGFFGFLEAQNDTKIFKLLFESAESWLKKKGVEHIIGPFSLNINQEIGSLIKGFETPPFFMMPNGKTYYANMLESHGYEKTIDLFAYLIKSNFMPPKLMVKILKKLPPSVYTRPINRKNLNIELETIRNIFNDAWSDNWGFLPFTKEEFSSIGREMLSIIPSDFIQIAFLDEEPVAFIVLLPNLNEVTADLNGKLLPIGWLKLIYRLKIKYPKSGRIPLMGVRKKFHDTTLGPGLALKVVDALREPGMRKGVEDVEMSWILESNSAMSNIIKILGGTLSKTYRLYKKDIEK